MSFSARGLLQIGEVAEATGLSLRTIRHYDEVGLLPPVERSPGGFRLYSQESVDRLLLVKQMKPLDFTLEQMRELIDALDEVDDPATTPDERAARQALLASYAELVEEKVTMLRARARAAAGFAAQLRRVLP
ncbi:MerR family transcriptional regulator [Lapillicoccus jejuensis]|uniref:DNA-binding transcriptional MerR regulator n=1 Tax=Lapillicoccus jejuensis TaxID=402171 RepID=A0A542E119_9MICO|nr:MerR family transcriptional regulator [Lapillicoccus jejuensis]TQJ09037.1 DNA-binding transcriptional MerR regulator [Lapillicoccus jejuensis]